MMTKTILLRAIAFAIGIALAAAQAQTPPAATAPAVSSAHTITVTHAWARPTPVSIHTAAAYMTLTTTGAPDHLIGASTPIAVKAEIHETVRDGNVMRMRPVAGGIPVAPDRPATLAPGGYHIMMMGVKQPLAAGTSFPLTLTFEHAPPLTTAVTVQVPGSSAAAMSGMSANGHDMPGMPTAKP